MAEAQQSGEAASTAPTDAAAKRVRIEQKPVSLKTAKPKAGVEAELSLGRRVRMWWYQTNWTREK